MRPYRSDFSFIYILITFSDPWWIFTTANLFWNIKYRYDLGLLEVVRVSPRFGLLLLSMSLSIVFITVDILCVTPVLAIGFINPFWKFAFIFKCFTDTIILDDFKTALDKLNRHKMDQIHRLPSSNPSHGPRTEEIEMGRRGGYPISSDRNSGCASIEQIERVSSDVGINTPTTDTGPSRPPIALMRDTGGYKKID